MALFSFTRPEEFDQAIPMLNSTDPNSNMVFNDLVQRLIHNDVFMNHLSRELLARTATVSADVSALKSLFINNALIEFKNIRHDYTNQSNFNFWKANYKNYWPQCNKIYIGEWWHSDQEIYFSRFYDNYSYGNTTTINCTGEIRVYRIINYNISAIQYPANAI